MSVVPPRAAALQWRDWLAGLCQDDVLICGAVDPYGDVRGMILSRADGLSSQDDGLDQARGPSAPRTNKGMSQVTRSQRAFEPTHT